MALLKRGERGDSVKQLQEKLGLEADGIFGKGTESALKEFQQGKDLDADGVAGPDTLMALGLNDLIVLKRGSKGKLVKALQAALELDDADGVYGKGTEAAVLTFQDEKGLDTDGIAGPDTLNAMGLFAAGAAADAAEKLGDAAAGALDHLKNLFSK